jgi:lipopolysaccharide transport system permease protein
MPSRRWHSAASPYTIRPVLAARQGRWISAADLSLLLRLVRRDFEARFAGSVLGLGWAIIHPLANIALYWVVFGLLLSGGRFGLGGEGDSYAKFLIAGLLPWMGFQEAVIRSSTSIVDNGVILKRIPFKSQILVAVPTVTALALEVVGLALFCVILLLMGHAFTWTLLLLPVALALQAVFQLGLGLLLAPVVTLFRDLQQVLGFVLYALFFLSPILYPVREDWKILFDWNPMTPLISLFRSAVLGGPLPSAGSFVYLGVVMAIVSIGGIRLTGKLGPTFVDTI